jgi:hypothetical protein
MLARVLATKVALPKREKKAELSSEKICGKRASKKLQRRNTNVG